jgi:hypothetical protein
VLRVLPKRLSVTNKSLSANFLPRWLCSPSWRVLYAPLDAEDDHERNSKLTAAKIPFDVIPKQIEVDLP